MSEKIIIGSIESGDLLITATPNNTLKNEINLNSKFLKQYKDEILKIIEDTCESEKITGLNLEVNDQGAIPAVIRARIKAVGRKYVELKN